MDGLIMENPIKMDDFLLGQWLNFKLFWDYIFSRENKVQTFVFRVHWLSEIWGYHYFLETSICRKVGSL